MKTLIGTIISSMLGLSEILVFVGIIFYIYSILGVSVWAGDINYRCRTTPAPVNGDWPVIANDTQLCGSRNCPVGFCGSLVYEYVHNPGSIDLDVVGSIYRDTNISDLNYGIVDFDQFLKAILTIFQCFTLEGWSQIMYIFEDSSENYISIIFFLSFILLCSMLFMDIICAVLLSNYVDNSKQSSINSEEISELENQGKEIKIPEEVLNIIINQDLIIDSKPKETLQRTYEIFTKLFQFKNKVQPPKSKYFEYKIPRFLFWLVNLKLFNAFIIFVIIFNTVVLCCDYYQIDDKSDPFTILENFNYAFVAIFTTEVVLKFFGLGAKAFIKDYFNIFDFLIVIVSTIDISLSTSSSSYSALRAFRLLRLFKMFKVGQLRVLMDSFLKTMKSIFPFIICVGIMILIFNLIGLTLYAGEMKFSSNGDVDKTNGSSPRINFDTFFSSLITVFSILVGDNWNSLMYDTVRSTNDFSVFYFIMVIIIGNIVMLQLLVAILIDNFIVSRKFSEKRFIISEIGKKCKSGMTMNDALK